MINPSVDIIVPVWNNLFETRSCLAAILTHSPEARLIVVDNGSSRETELMLEEFSESLGDHGLFMTCERNIGLIPSINRALAQSEGEYVVIVRPQVTVSAGWLEQLLKTADQPQTGIVTPVFRGNAAPAVTGPLAGYPQMETFSLSFAALLLKGNLYRAVGGFDEGMDGGEWCLKDYIRRAEAAGFHTRVTAAPLLQCGPETVFGSNERRQEQLRTSRELYLSRWGIARHYCIYWGKYLLTDLMAPILETILASARQGNRFTLLLHRKQYKEFRKRGWNGLHTAMSVQALPLLGTTRSLKRQIADLQSSDPDVILVKGSQEVQFPNDLAAITFNGIAAFQKNGYPAEALNDPTPEAP